MVVLGVCSGRTLTRRVCCPSATMAYGRAGGVLGAYPNPLCVRSSVVCVAALERFAVSVFFFGFQKGFWRCGSEGVSGRNK